MNQQGQSLVEFSASIALLTLLVGGASSVLYAEWDRVRCANQVFEETHAVLTGALARSRKVAIYSKNRGRNPIRIHDDIQFVTGEARCGNAVEKVRFTRLEAMEW